MESPSLVINMHDEVFDCIEAIESFRRFCPGGEIRLTGNSAKHVDRVSKITGLNYSISPKYFDQIARIRDLPKEQRQRESVSVLTELFDFFLQVSRQLPSSKIFFMHPDHRMVRRPKNHELTYRAELTLSNPVRPEVRSTWEKVFKKALTLNNYGIPTYFDRDVLIESLEFLLHDESKVMRELISENEVFVYDDLLLAAAIAHLGHEIKFKGLTRELRRRIQIRFLFKKPLLVHQIDRITPAN